MVGYAGDPVDAARARIDEAASSLKSPIQTTASDLLGDTREIIGNAANGVETRVRAGVADEMNHQASSLTERVRANNTIVLGQGIEARPVQSARLEQQQYYLYFIRFSNGRSELVRVRRKIGTATTALDLTGVLLSLQKGPSLRERGLINAFTDRIPIYSIQLLQGIAVVDAGAPIGSMGVHVIRDRLDQLVYTLTQFPEVHGVRLLINGRQESHLGHGNVKLPAIMRGGGRKIQTIKLEN